MVNPLTNPLRGRPLPLGSLISAAGQRLAAELDQALEAAGFPELRSAHSRIFMVIDPEGTRVTDLADRMGITKQATGELIRYLSTHGYLVVTPEPADQRARRVTLTQRGWRVIEAGEQVIERFDRWLDDTVGAEQVQQLRAVLSTIVEVDPSTR